MRNVWLFGKKKIGPAMSVFALILAGAVSMNQATWAQERAAGAPPVMSDKARQRQQLAEQLKVTMEQVKKIQRALKDLDGGTAAESEMASVAAAAEKEDAAVLAPVEVLGTKIERNPEGRVIGKVEREDIENSRAFSLKELVEAVPGITARQGNGPRDVNISIRGSGAKQSFGVRNIKTYEDWFPTTQSDGLSRTDVNDPHAYEGVDIIRGPSSSLYDKEAMGGAINFRTRRGRDIQGVEVGNDGGSRGYHNHWLHMGDQLKNLEYSLFGSYIRSDGYIRHSAYNTATENILATFTPDDKRSFTFKFLSNDMDGQVPSRLTRSQFQADPRSAGTTTVTGIAGAVTAEQAAQARRDRRTIVGGRYEQQLDANTGLRMLGAYDVKDINQTFGTIGDTSNPNFHTYADITREGTVGGLNAKHYAGFFFNYMEQEASTYRNLADGFGTRGAIQANTRGDHRNMGGRLREEIQFDPKWSGVAGIGVESSNVSAQVQNRTAAETFSRIGVNRNFFNVAPELAVIYKHSPDLIAHGRVGTGYGIPSIGNLTTASNGLPGNNLDLKPQQNVGFELGVDGRPVKAVSLSLTGFYEFWINEFITQSPGAGLSNFTSNAPNATHRGVEAALDWRPIEGWHLTTAYTFNDQRYTTFNEKISGVPFDREGKQIPGVERHFANARVRYESLYHLGAWLEMNWMDDYFANNNNTLKTEAYAVYNLNVHYNRELAGPILKGLSAYVEIQNLFNNTYIASAQVVSDAAGDTPFNLATTKQAFFTGDPRSYFAGIKLKF